MLITYGDYTGLGYNVIPETAFPRYEALARKAVDKFCFQRVTAESIQEDNKRGMCELAELYYFDKNPQEDDANKVVASFSNNGYSESYASKGTAPAKTLETKVYEVIGLFFTAEQLYRGVECNV